MLDDVKQMKKMCYAKYKNTEKNSIIYRIASSNQIYTIQASTENVNVLIR